MNNKNANINQSISLALRSILFILLVLIMLPLANLVQAYIIQELSIKMYNSYLPQIDASSMFWVDFFTSNLIYSVPLYFSFLAWVPFMGLNLLFAKLMYRNNASQKQVFRVVLIACCVKLGLHIIFIGGATICKLLFGANENLIVSLRVDDILSSLVGYSYYGSGGLNRLLDICFAITLLVGMLIIFKSKIKNCISKTLGGKAS